LVIHWAEPAPVQESQLLRAHSSRHLGRLAQPVDFGPDTPTHAGILEHAKRSVGGALQAMHAARKGEKAFSLLRPPGHHATREQAMGFCYLNSMAITVLEALAQEVGNVAVFDFDVHHGNGTEEILLGQDKCVYISVHQYPAYPGTGATSRQNAWNHPVPAGASRAQWRASLAEALDQLHRFKPALVGASAGFDAYSGDPLSYAALEQEDFYWLGQSLRNLGAPVFSVLEGGYSNELPELIFNYLRGLSGC
jgi:acetoin utilization deacetylase AcuC-like enzyme